MSTKKYLSKEDKIKREITKLKKTYANLDKNKAIILNSAIENTAFMIVSLEELKDKINGEGYTSEYKNGENQFGTKKSATVEIYLSMTKNHTANMKLLTDLAPPEKRKNSKLDALFNE